MISARSCLAACVALLFSACDGRDQPGTGAVEQPGTITNSPQQNTLVGNLAGAAGYDARTLGPGDPKWAQVFEAGVFEIGRQCDQYLDTLSRTRDPRAAATAIAGTATALGLPTSLFDAGTNSALFTTDPAALRNTVQNRREAYLDRLLKDNFQINNRLRLIGALQDYLRQCSAAEIESSINTSGAPPSVTSPSLSTMTRTAAIVSGVVALGAPLPASAFSTDAAPKETVVIPELKEAQRALGVSDDGQYGPLTRGAIREFQTGMFRRDPGTWLESGITGNLTSRAGRTLPTLKPMPAIFMSPFERAFLGNDSGFFSADPLSTIDPRQLDYTLNLLGVEPDQVAAAATLDDKLKLLRARIAKLRADFGLPMDKGPILDAALFKEVWKTSPMNPNRTG
jgi:hypothetical protein